MPTISNFYGIIIIMNQRGREHAPPHVHAITENYNTPFLIQTGEVMAGDFPHKGKALVKEFILKNQDALLLMWESGEFKKLEPLD